MPVPGDSITIDEFFEGRSEKSRRVFDAVRAVVESLGPVEVRATKSQVAFHRRLGFAWVWTPEQYLHGSRDLAPLVLTVGLGRRDPSPRWKQIVEPRPGRFTHHLELRSAEQVDDEVVAWLREAWEGAE
jgi:hypothetical protein